MARSVGSSRVRLSPGDISTVEKPLLQEGGGGESISRYNLVSSMHSSILPARMLCVKRDEDQLGNQCVKNAFPHRKKKEKEADDGPLRFGSEPFFLATKSPEPSEMVLRPFEYHRFPQKSVWSFKALSPSVLISPYSAILEPEMKYFAVVLFSR